MSKQVQQYFSQIPAERNERIQILHFLIVNLYPEAEVDMTYKMPTYKVGDAWVALANQKNYISLYTCGYHHIESFKENYPKIKTGKGCINFRDKDPLPVEDIKEVVRHAIEHPKPE
jgi:uncharacterized protein YdhG (YjbR/CyaY superfamily)